MARELRIQLQQAMAEAGNAAIKRRLEREFGGTIKLGFPRLRKLRASYVASPSRQAASVWLAPTLRNNRRAYSRGADGRRSFHCKVTYIPRTMRPRTLNDGTRIRPGAALASAKYQSGEGRDGYLAGERIQKNDQGDPHFESNISPTCLADNFEFFRLVEEFERKPSKDKVVIEFSHDPGLWLRVVNDPDCEPAIREARNKFPLSRTNKIELDRGGDYLFKIMRRHGFQPAAHYDAAGKKRSDGDRAQLDGIKWVYGRGGVTQIRIVHALPHEFSAAQRDAALKEICADLHARGLMYFAVIHEPEASNDERNYHVHIDIYDRPCRRLTGTDDDLDYVNPKLVEQVRADVAAGLLADRRHQWDFTYIREYKSSSGNKLRHRPFRQNKVRAANSKDFTLELRRMVESKVNGVAKAHGMDPIYDARTYKEMGVRKVPDVTLGPAEHALARRGIPTPKSIINERRHAAARMRMIQEDYRHKMLEIDLFEGRICRASEADTAGSRAALEEQAQAKAELERMRALVDAQREAHLLALAFDRSISTWDNLSDQAERMIAANSDPDGEFRLRRDAGNEWYLGHNADLAEAVQTYELLTIQRRELMDLIVRVGERVTRIEQTVETRNVLVEVEQKAGPEEPAAPLPVSAAEAATSASLTANSVGRATPPDLRLEDQLQVQGQRVARERRGPLEPQQTSTIEPDSCEPEVAKELPETNVQATAVDVTFNSPEGSVRRNIMRTRTGAGPQRPLPEPSLRPTEVTALNTAPDPMLPEDGKVPIQSKVNDADAVVPPRGERGHPSTVHAAAMLRENAGLSSLHERFDEKAGDQSATLASTAEAAELDRTMTDPAAPIEVRTRPPESPARRNIMRRAGAALHGEGVQVSIRREPQATEAVHYTDDEGENRSPCEASQVPGKSAASSSTDERVNEKVRLLSTIGSLGTETGERRHDIQDLAGGAVPTADGVNAPVATGTLIAHAQDQCSPTLHGSPQLLPPSEPLGERPDIQSAQKRAASVGPVEPCAEGQPDRTALDASKATEKPARPVERSPAPIAEDREPRNRFGQTAWQVEELIKRWNGDDLPARFPFQEPVADTSGPISRSIATGGQLLRRGDAGIIAYDDPGAALALQKAWLEQNPAIAAALLREQTKRLDELLRQQFADLQADERLSLPALDDARPLGSAPEISNEQCRALSADEVAFRRSQAGYER